MLDREQDGRSEGGAAASDPMQALPVMGVALDPNPEARSHSTISLSAPVPDGLASTGLPIAPGSIIKQYEVLRELGQGAMGAVYLARDTRLARLCAIKFMLACSGAGAGRFLAEAQATARCKHESIVAIYEVDEIEGYPYMVLEYLEGRTLRAWMAACDGALAPSRAAELMVPVVRALVYAHDMGIVHRDLKPENIFVTDDGQIKVLDFGVAKRIGAIERAASSPAPAQHADPGLTKQGAVIGTRPYMAPEQWLGSDITPQTDLWAVGVILYELVTGSHPLAPVSGPRLNEVQDLDTPMPSMYAQRSDVGPLGVVIDRCLKKHRSERIGSAAELLADLERLVERRTAPAGRHHRWRTNALAATLTAVIAALIVVWLTGLPGRLGSGNRVGSSGTAITDVPLPSSSRPEAQAAYRAALHGFRDANWASAEYQLRRAIALDPTLAAAHLRMAILRHYVAGRAPEVRESYALAVQWRAMLSARDREILAAFEPLFSREPPELVRFGTQLGELAAHRRDDAEIQALLTYFGSGGPEIQLRAARRAVELDPGYADGWQAVGKHLFALGRSDEALRAFDACLAVSPAAVDCLGERARVYVAAGQCAAAESDLRSADAATPQGGYWQDLWASAALAQGKPAETAIEVLSRRWAVQPETRRELVEYYDRARIDLLRGRFEAARASALALQASIRRQPTADQHARYAMLLIDLAIEADRPDDAAALADDYLRRRGAWISADIDVDDIAMLTVLRDAGRISPAEFDARRAAWLADHRDLATSLPSAVWVAAWARPAISTDAAVAALAQAPTRDLRSSARSIADHAAIGALLARTGRTADAIPFLQRAAHGCDGFLAPVAHVRAAAQLARALEATGDRAGACAAYERVQDRWGVAAARSVTARDAQHRAAALGCEPPADRAASTPPR